MSYHVGVPMSYRWYDIGALVVRHWLRLKMKVLRSVGAFIMACFLLFSSGCEKSKWSSQTMKCCLAAMEDGMGLNAASRAFGIPKPTIRRHRLGLNKYASDDVKCMGGPLSLPAAVEDELVKHVKDLDDMMFGMTAKYLMGLAYEVAVAHGVRKFSDVKKSAGKNGTTTSCVGTRIRLFALRNQLHSHALQVSIVKLCKISSTCLRN